MANGSRINPGAAGAVAARLAVLALCLLLVTALDAATGPGAARHSAEAGAAPLQQPRPADSVWHSGKIYTVDEEFSVAEALAVRGEALVYVGPNAGAQAFVGPDTEVIDLAGRAVVPGLIDTHVHWRDQYEPRYLAVGLTTVHDMNKTRLDGVARFKRAYANGDLKIRMNVMLHTAAAFEMGTPEIGLFGNRLSIHSTKVHADNRLGRWQASLFEEYSDRPGLIGPWGPHRLHPTTGSGQDQEAEYTETVVGLIERGFQPKTHAIGDFTNHKILNVYERALRRTGKTGREVRPVIEHAQVIQTEDVKRYAEIGVVASIQAIHGPEDMPWAEDRLGPHRIYRGYRWRDMLDAGVIISGSSDHAVSPYNPWYGLHAAVTRQDRDNNPPGGWYPEQAMTREEALRTYTNGGAYNEFNEQVKGSLEVGKLADFVVIDRDYMTIPAEEIWRIRALQTVIGGEVVYRSPDAEPKD